MATATARSAYTPVITRNCEGVVVARDYRRHKKGTTPGEGWEVVLQCSEADLLKTFWERPATEEEIATATLAGRFDRPEGWWNRD